MKKVKCYGAVGILLAVLFTVFTVCAVLVDVATVGPLDSSVGFSTVNKAVHDAIGTSEVCYELSELLGLISLGAVGAFGVLGLVQLIRRKSIRRVDADLWALCAFYAVVAIAYVLFEVAVINYRPLLSEGSLEASYPSSHTLLSVCVMSTAAIQLYRRVKSTLWRTLSVLVAILIPTLNVALRFLSGVHWLTDIIGGLLLSASLVCLYAAAVKWLDAKKQ